MLAQQKRIENVQPVSYMTLTQNVERRQHRRHDLAEQDLPVYATIDGTPADTAMGQLKDISAGGMRFVTRSASVRPNSRLAVQLSLPNYAGIRPFIDRENESAVTEWAGYLSVTRVIKLPDGGYEIAGRLLDMSEGERGLLGLYLSTQPLAA